MNYFRVHIASALIALSALSPLGSTLASAKTLDKQGPTGAQVRVCLQQRNIGRTLNRVQRTAIRAEYRSCIRRAVMLNNGHTHSVSSRRSSSSSSLSSSSRVSSRRSSASSSSQATSSSSIASSSQASAQQSSVTLGAASTFAVLAGSTVTNIGQTIITGDVGVSAGSAVTGFPPATVNGGALHAADSSAAQAQLALTVAYNDLAGRSTSPVSVAGNLGGTTLSPGLYKSTGSLEISSGDLTLDAKGDSNALFILQMASTLNVTAGRHVVLIGGAKASNVFWQVGTSANLGSTSIFKGSILADQSISLQTGASVEGRLLARIGAVTLQGNTITVPAN